MLCRAEVDSRGRSRGGPALRLHAAVLRQYQRQEPEGDLEGDDPILVVPGSVLLSDEGSGISRGAQGDYLGSRV